MTCKDCVHYEVCSIWSKGDLNECCNDNFKSNSEIVKVVKCKDCKHWNEREMECKNDYIVTDNEGGASFSLNFYLDDFCSYGERKE